MRRSRPVRAAAALLTLAALALGAAPAARAGVTSCTVTATSIAFGIYTPLQTSALDANGTIAVACTGVTGNNPIYILLSTGNSGNYNSRTLTTGASTLSYNIYATAATTYVWGNGTGVSYEVETFVTNLAPTANLTMYGMVNSGQDPAPGTYTDSITVTVNY